MLGNLKENDSVYILDKSGRPELSPGVVVEVKQPKTQFGQPAVPGNNFLPTFVDMVVRVNGETIQLQKLPCEKDIVDNNGGFVISDNRDAMCAYVDNMMRTSAAALNEIERHRQIVEACEEIIPTLNPTIAKEKERDTAIDNRFKRIEDMLLRLLEEKPSKSE